MIKKSGTPEFPYFIHHGSEIGRKDIAGNLVTRADGLVLSTLFTSGKKRLENSLFSLNEGYAVLETAGRCGFEDSFYFIRKFRKQYLMMPGKYPFRIIKINNFSIGSKIKP